MSERWVLVPVAPTEEMSSHQMPGSWELSLAARPPVSRDWLDAAVERAARAAWENSGHYPMQAWYEVPNHTREVVYGEVRAAILAALEMTDEQ